MTDESKNDALLTEAIKRSGNEEISRLLIEDAKVFVSDLLRAQSDLISKSIRDIKARIDIIAKPIADAEKRESVVGLIGLNVADEIVSILLLQAAETAAVSKTRLPRFIGQAAELFEAAMIRTAQTAMRSMIMDMLLSIKPEPPKENLS